MNLLDRSSPLIPVLRQICGIKQEELPRLEAKIPSSGDHYKQRAFIEHLAKRKIARAGRRGGKTEGAAIIAMLSLLAGRRILYAVPVSDQLEAFWVAITTAFAEPIGAGLLYKNETEHVIEVPGTKQRIRGKTAYNADTLRGDYADLIIFDEWQLMAEDAWDLVGAPMLLDNDGDAVFIYTPPSLHSRLRQSVKTKAKDPQHAAKMFKKFQMDTTGRYAAFHWTSHDNPFISKHALDEITQDMTSLAIKMEIMAEDVEEVPGALWTREMIDDPYRLLRAPELSRIVVAVDPSVTTGGNEAGVITVGKNGEEGYVISDDSVEGSPLVWATAAVTAYHKFKADRIIAEANNGGEMVEITIHQVDPTVPVKLVHASRGKAEWLKNPILTTRGWKTFDSLKDGDMIFNHAGIPSSVSLLPICEAPCAEIVMSDGTSGIYALDHEWRVLPYSSVRTFTNVMNAGKDWTRWRSAGVGNYPRSLTLEMKLKAKELRNRGASWAEVAKAVGSTIGSVNSALNWHNKGLDTCVQFVERTTSEMMKDIFEGVTYLIPNSPPLEMTGTSYIDPYLLGLWLGDGSVGAAVLSQKTPDDTDHIYKELKDRGFDIVSRHGRLYIKNLRWAFTGRNRKCLYGDEWMVRTDERLDLIRGLIDSDGTRKSRTSISLSQSGYRINDVLLPACDAMRSLGWTVNKPYRKKTDREPAEIVTIHPTVVDCSILPRKHIEFVPHSSRYRTIISIKAVGIHPVRCISVETPEHLYLSGRGLIATHNSTRAEPISAMYEKHKVHHVGTFPALEDEMVLWLPGSPSPNRMDALVWGLTELMITGVSKTVAQQISLGISVGTGPESGLEPEPFQNKIPEDLEWINKYR